MTIRPIRPLATLTILMLCAVTTLQAQQQTFPTDYFKHPLQLPVSLAGDFAEIRPNHFHSGIDLRTGGKEGEKVYAPADGYVSRINISAWGGGKILYITHPNGYRTVYMHLSAFCGEIAQFVHNYQYDHHVYAFDIDLPKDSIKVKQGQLVALTGNTGGSSGPHLHYDIRYASNDQAINPLYFGIRYSDPIAPTIDNIKIYPANSSTTINGKNAEWFLNQPKKNSKTSNRQDTIAIAGRFYTGIYTYDRMEQGSSSKNGVEKIELYVDGELFHRYQVSSFMFEETRAINAIIDYPQYQRNRNYYIVTRHLRGNRNHWSAAYRDNGYLQFDDNGIHRLEYQVSDYKGNITKRTFYVRSLPLPDETKDSLRNIQAQGDPIIYFKPYTFSRDGFTVVMQPYTVYENDEVLFTQSTDAARLSQRYTLSLKRHPLPPHQSFNVGIPIPEKVPASLRSKLTIVCINGKSTSACTTTIDGDRLTASTRSFGSFAVRLDTVAPSVTPVNFGNGKRHSASTLVVKISDNLTGVVAYHCYINGEWVLAEHDGKTATLTASANTLKRGNNKVTFVVTDAVGNSVEQTWTLVKS